MLYNSNERLEREARESLVASDLSAKMKQWRDQWFAEKLSLVTPVNPNGVNWSSNKSLLVLRRLFIYVP